MKKIVLETIDGSIENIIQLKTLDNSLEFSQMFDALEDTPRDFQTKLIDALNSLGETMQITPTEAFNKVLCRSDEKNEGLRKKLYNWWRAFFEVLGKLTDGKMPKVRLSEYNEKIDDLMAEIMKSGDAEASTEEDTPVMESTKPRFKKGDFVVVRNGDDARVLRAYRDRVDKSIWYEVWIMDGNRTTEFRDDDVYASRKEYEAKYMYEEESALESSKPRFEKGRVVFTRKGGHRGMVVKCSKEDGRYFYTIAWMGSEHGFAEFWEDELCLKSELTLENYEQAAKGDDVYASRKEYKAKHLCEEEIVSERSLSFAEKHGVKKGDPVEVWLYCMGKGSWARGFTYVCGGSYGEYVWVTDGRGKYEMPVDCVRPIEYVNEEYEQATKKDEDKMMADMDFAIQHLGEVANKVKAVVNFINPYCERTFNEENIAMKKPGRYGIGDHVLYKGEKCVVIDVDEDLMNDEEIYQVSRDSDKVDGLSFNDWVTWDEIEPAEGFVEEEVKKNNMKKTNETGASEFWKAMDDVDDLERKGYWSGKFKVGDKVNWIEPDEGYPSDGWTIEDVTSGEHPSGDDLYIISRGKSSVMNISGSELRPAKMANEVKDASDDWVSWDEMVGESGATKKVSLYVDWDDDGAGLDSNVVIDVPAEIADSEESTALYDYIADWIDQQDFCVNDWAITDIEGLDNDVELEGTDEGDLENELDKGDDGWVEIGQPVGESKPVELESDGFQLFKPGTDVIATMPWGDEEGTIVKAYKDHYEVKLWDQEEIKAVGLTKVRKWEEINEGTDWKEISDEAVLENNDEEVTSGEVTSSDVKDGEKQVTQDGETKTLVAGEEENKKPVCEMTIEQEIDDPWKLSELLWSQGKENLEELLRSELVGEEEIMQMLEDTGVRNLTNINDLFAYDFPSVLDSLGLDGEAWSQNLEIKRKEDNF